MIFNLQRYSTHDGPGIRSVVFLKGCSLSCRWCQNPESREMQPQLLFDERLCLSECDLCQQSCPQQVLRQEGKIALQRHKLTTETIATLSQCCPTGALQACGKVYDPDDLMAILLRDQAYYQRSGGGVTLSGGEPFMQPELAADILQRCHVAGIHTAAESCLHVPWSYIEPSIPWLQLMLADLKHTDLATMKSWTGGSAKRVMENLHRLSHFAIPLIIRVPIIPDFNANRVDLQNIIDFVAHETAAQEIHFLPYHTLGIHKYHLLDLPYQAARTPLDDPELLLFAEHYARSQGLTVLLRG